MTMVEKIIRSFKRDYDKCKGEDELFWFQRWEERSSILLGEVTVEEAITLHTYGISSENEDDRITYRVDNLERFKAAVA